MKNDISNYIIFIIAIPFLFRLLHVLGSENPSYLVTGSIGIILLMSIFSPKYFNKQFLHILICYILFSGLILSYTYLFEPMYVSSDEYYYAIWALLFNIVLFAYFYLRRNNPKSLDLKRDDS